MLKSKNIRHLAANQYASADNLHARWDLYESSLPKIDIHQTGIDHLDLTGDEDILDVGCGDGSVLLNLRRNGHAGKLVGLEINSEIFKDSVAAQTKEGLQPKIEFIIGSADKLPFPDKSFDVIIAFFMLYHMPDIQKTLMEWKRVLKDDGKVLISTNSSFNKPKHKKFKRMAKKLIGNTTAPQFTPSFNIENGEDQLKDILKIIDKFIYEGQIKLDKPEPYLNAFNSTRDMYDPIPSDSDWNRVENAVKLEVEREIMEKGYFSDNVRRGFFICKKI